MVPGEKAGWPHHRSKAETLLGKYVWVQTPQKTKTVLTEAEDCLQVHPRIMGARLALFHLTSQKNAFRNLQVSLTLAPLSQTRHGALRVSREHPSDSASPCPVLLRLRSGGFQTGHSAFCVLEDCHPTRAAPVPQMVKCLPAVQETGV